MKLYQEATALIQMLHGQDCPQAPQGFWKSLAFRGSRPAIRKFEVDHLHQTIYWTIPLLTHAPPPERSTFNDNRQWLENNRLEVMAVGKRPPRDDALFYFDKRSTRSAANTGKHSSGGGARCDTCTIISSRKNEPTYEPCQYNPETDTYQSCSALGRVCTFTPITALLSGWVGRDVNPKDYISSGKEELPFPRYSGGRIRRLIPHWSMPGDVANKVMEIPEPYGWQSLYAAIDAGEVDAEDMDVGGDGQEVEED